MSQHFLLSKAARSLSLARVARLSDGEAFDAFRLIRWSATKGEPVCPRCDCAAVYTYKARKLWKCKACSHQFYVTSGTIFASRKLPIRDYLLAIAIFVNGAKGHSALQLSRDLDVQYKTAFVMAHKIREAITADADERTLAGHVEVDGAYFGGYVKPANNRENRRDRRLAVNQTGKRKVVVVMRERGGELRSASTIISQVPTFRLTLRRWRGARIIAASRTASSTSWRRKRRYGTQCRGCGKGTGSGQQIRCAKPHIYPFACCVLLCVDGINESAL